MKKIILILAIICQLCVMAQNPEDFKELLKGETGGLLIRNLCVANKHLYVTRGGQPAEQEKWGIVELDTNHNVKYYNKYNSPVMSYSSYSSQEVKILKDNICWISTDDGFLVFKEGTETDESEFLHRYSSKNIKGFSFCGGEQTNEITAFCFDKTGEYVYYIACGFDLFRMKTDNPDTAEHILYLGTHEGGLNIWTPGYIPMIADEDTIWFMSAFRPAFVRYDTKTKEVMIYDSTMVDKYGNSLFPKAGVDTRDIMILSQKYNYAKIALVEHHIIDNEDTLTHSKLLKYDNGEWDTIVLPPHSTDTSMWAYKLCQWSEDEIGIVFGTSQIASNYKILIYNISTGIWNNFELPKSADGFPVAISDVIAWNDKHYFLTPSSLMVYDPDNSIPEPTIIKNYSLFPNPASDDCTLSMDMTESGSVSISLSDMLGRDIMQIYDGYAEAGAFSKAFNTKHLASGVYSVIIRIGDKAKAEKLIINR